MLAACLSPYGTRPNTDRPWRRRRLRAGQKLATAARTLELLKRATHTVHRRDGGDGGSGGPLLLGFQVSQLSTLLSPPPSLLPPALTCRSVPQVPLHLREGHLGEVQRRSVALQERADLREARAERRAGAPHHRRSSHLSKRRETGGEGALLDATSASEMNGGREAATGVKLLGERAASVRRDFQNKTTFFFACTKEQ